jgi:hypothetical protein
MICEYRTGLATEERQEQYQAKRKMEMSKELQHQRRSASVISFCELSWIFYEAETNPKAQEVGSKVLIKANKVGRLEPSLSILVCLRNRNIAMSKMHVKSQLPGHCVLNKASHVQVLPFVQVIGR